MRKTRAISIRVKTTIFSKTQKPENKNQRPKKKHPLSVSFFVTTQWPPCLSSELQISHEKENKQRKKNCFFFFSLISLNSRLFAMLPQISQQESVWGELRTYMNIDPLRGHHQRDQTCNESEERRLCIFLFPLLKAFCFGFGFAFSFFFPFFFSPLNAVWFLL